MNKILLYSVLFIIEIKINLQQSSLQKKFREYDWPNKSQQKKGANYTFDSLSDEWQWFL